jgi:hypothetical protein
LFLTVSLSQKTLYTSIKQFNKPRWLRGLLNILEIGLLQLVHIKKETFWGAHYLKTIISTPEVV